MIIFMYCTTVNNKSINLKKGDKVSAFGADGKHYSGIVDIVTNLKFRRYHINNADLSSNYYRISKVNGVSYM
mgnify:FL=1|tara:strand:- start:949 stop:1164 length:216 start_codon:yes stop_codon:yes gene_type:complete